MANSLNLNKLFVQDPTLIESSGGAINLFSLADIVGKQVYVYGYGRGYITLKTFLLDKYKIPVRGIFDSKFIGSNNSPIENLMDPSNFNLGEEDSKDAIAIISVGSPAAQKDLIIKLASMGFKKVITAFQIYEYHLSHESVDFSLNPIRSLLKSEVDIDAAYQLLADDKSKRIYEDILKVYAGFVSNLIEFDPIDRQYFPLDVHLAKGKSRFINCGSFDGDTIRQLIDKFGKVESLVCFEPDAENYNSLTKYLAENSDDIASNIFAFPCGIYSENKQLYFNSGNQVNSTVCEYGDALIQCVSIDSALPNFEPTYINMDIEGSEPDAIRGASKTIRQFKPDLAVCVYHKPNHLWDIVLQIQALSKGYQFYLRNYTGYPAETVLYCTHRPE